MAARRACAGTGRGAAQPGLGVDARTARRRRAGRDARGPRGRRAHRVGRGVRGRGRRGVLPDPAPARLGDRPRRGAHRRRLGRVAGLGRRRLRRVLPRPSRREDARLGQGPALLQMLALLEPPRRRRPRPVHRGRGPPRPRDDQARAGRPGGVVRRRRRPGDPRGPPRPGLPRRAPGPGRPTRRRPTCARDGSGAGEPRLAELALAGAAPGVSAGLGGGRADGHAGGRAGHVVARRDARRHLPPRRRRPVGHRRLRDPVRRLAAVLPDDPGARVRARDAAADDVARGGAALDADARAAAAHDAHPDAGPRRRGPPGHRARLARRATSRTSGSCSTCCARWSAGGHRRPPSTPRRCTRRRRPARSGPATANRPGPPSRTDSATRSSPGWSGAGTGSPGRATGHWGGSRRSGSTTRAGCCGARRTRGGCRGTRSVGEPATPAPSLAGTLWIMPLPSLRRRRPRPDPAVRRAALLAGPLLGMGVLHFAVPAPVRRRSSRRGSRGPPGSGPTPAGSPSSPSAPRSPARRPAGSARPPPSGSSSPSTRRTCRWRGTGGASRGPTAPPRSAGCHCSTR